MPSQLLHTLFGEDVIAGIYRRMENRFGIEAAKTLEAVQNTWKNVFALGCQGPDIFYHSRRRRPVGLEYGTLLHRRGIGLFVAELLDMAFPASQAKVIDERGVYALGFMTHAVLDRAAHPFIVYKTYVPPKYGSISYAQAHAFFERIIDVRMLKIVRGLELSSWNQERMLAETCANPPPHVKELLAQALIRTFPERAGKDGQLQRRIENTFHDSAVFYRLTAPVNVPREILEVPPAAHKNHLVYIYPEELPEQVDFLNLEKRPWFYPAGEKREDTRSFPEMYAEAVEKAVDSFAGIISRYLEQGFFPKEALALAVGNGGLSIVDDAGFPCSPCRAAPLPLDDVVEQQVRIRRRKIT